MTASPARAGTISRFIFEPERLRGEVGTAVTRRNTFDGDGSDARSDDALAIDQDFESQTNTYPAGSDKAATHAGALKAPCRGIREQQTSLDQNRTTRAIENDQSIL